MMINYFFDNFIIHDCIINVFKLNNQFHKGKKVMLRLYYETVS
jgi:hypothetical protein